VTASETATQPETIPQYFLEAARKYGDRKVAMRQKRLGIWQESTWKDSYEEVRALSLGLVELGMKRGDRIVIIGDNDREYIWADLAVLCAGAASVGIFIDAIPSEIEYVVNHSDAAFVFAKDQEQCDKLLAIKNQVPRVRNVIYWEDRGLWGYSDNWLVDYKEVQALGRRIAEQDKGRFEAMVAASRKDDPAAFCYTSGTTGRPKGAVLPHSFMIHVYQAVANIDPRLPNDNHISFLSLAWVAEHVFGVAAHAVDHVILSFPEEPETLQQDIREIAPEEILFNSRLWENLVGIVQMRINDSTWINRMLYHMFLPVGYAVADRLLEKKPVNPWLRFKYGLGDLLLFAPLRDKLGLSRVRTALTTGAALSSDVVRFFCAIGIELKQLYGATEAGIVAMHRSGDINFYSVGKRIPGFDLQISPEGEVLIGSPALFHGYHKDPVATEKATCMDAEGRRLFRTGDAGRISEDGHLIFYDRMDDMIHLPAGGKYSPQYIEGHLKFDPAIRDVMTIGGDERDYVTAILTIDFENAGRWAEKHGLAYTTFADLSQKPEIYDLLKKDVQRVNQTLPASARVRRFVSLHKEFDADEGEMTRTRKLRRRFLHERYAEIIAAMYKGDESIRVSATVQYRDGREGTFETTLDIVTVETEDIAV
jgi:long-chain acyl-CoA synthetase